MDRRMALPTVMAAASLALATGCTRDTDFDLTQSFHIVTTANEFHGVETVDLSQQAGSAWDHRDKLKSVTVTSATATITSVNPGNLATIGSATVALRPDGAPADGSGDVPLGDWTDVPVANGTMIELQGSPGLNGTVNAALEGSGILSFVVDATSDDAMDVDVEVRLRVSVEYSVSPF